MFTELANRFGTDKGTLTAAGHGYTLVYDMLFPQMSQSVTALCEVGLSRGGPEVAEGSAERDVADVPSVRMWHEMFPNARIVGVDISDCSGFANEWFSFVQADAGDAEQLARVAELGLSFDIVVDDGSHASFHQQQTFLSLFPLVRPGGFFIIEDLHWQPATYEGKLPAVPRTDILLEKFIRTGTFGETGALSSSRWAAMAEQIDTVSLYDEEWLAAHRRLTNIRAARKPEFVSRIDSADSADAGPRGRAGRIKRAVVSAIVGREHRAYYPTTKLAVIRKKAAQ